MIIDLSSFLYGSDNLLSFKGELSETESGLKEQGIIMVGPIEYEGEIFKADGENAINMKISFKYEESCSRCLEPSVCKIETTLFGRLVEGQEKIDSEDDSLEDDYDDRLYYENEILNLKDYIVNQVVVSLPMKSLCSEDCKGLCILCGIDLNKNTCECVHEDIDPRLEKLKNFFPKK